MARKNKDGPLPSPTFVQIISILKENPDRKINGN